MGDTDRLALICACVLLLMALVAVAAPVITPASPNAINFSAIFRGVSFAHPLGTDASGRDILARLIAGARSSLLGPSLVALLATALGTTIAVSSAWLGGWVDVATARAIDITFSFPALLLAVLAVAIFGVGLKAPVIAIAIAYVPYIARVIRSAALRERHLPYIEAATVQGLSGWTICRRHLLPNLTPLVIAQGTIAFGYAMVDLAAISFLGLGVQPPAADWGAMVAEGQSSVLRGHPGEALSGGALIVVAVMALILLGERIAERWEHRL